MSFRRHRLTIVGLVGLVLGVGLGVVALLVIYTILSLLGAVKLLDYSLIASLVVVELPLAVILSYLFGERRRERLSEALDTIELAQKYAHLRLHYWSIIPKTSILQYYVVENLNTHMAYDCPAYMVSIAHLGIIPRVKHKNETEMRTALENKHVPFFERDASFAEIHS